MRTIRYNPSAGIHISHACKTAIALAQRKNKPVTFRFNGIRIKANKRLSVRHIERQFDEQMAARSRRYRESSRGKADAAKRLEEIRLKQSSVDTCIERLPGLLEIKSLDTLMEWLSVFTVDADDIAVCYDKKPIAILFESYGFKESEHVGQKPEWFDTRERVAHYIIGQAINCLRLGKGPHPITLSFVAKYFALPKP